MRQVSWFGRRACYPGIVCAVRRAPSSDAGTRRRLRYLLSASGAPTLWLPLSLIVLMPVALFAEVHATVPSVLMSERQGISAGQTAPPAPGTLGRDPAPPETSGRIQEQMADRRNSERQKQLVADTQKLYELAEQLRDEVAKSNKDQLSVPVIKRSEQIEKLARSVREKMRGY